MTLIEKLIALFLLGFIIALMIDAVEQKKIKRDVKPASTTPETYEYPTIGVTPRGTVGIPIAPGLVISPSGQVSPGLTF